MHFKRAVWNKAQAKVLYYVFNYNNFIAINA